MSEADQLALATAVVEKLQSFQPNNGQITDVDKLLLADMLVETLNADYRPEDVFELARLNDWAMRDGWTPND